MQEDLCFYCREPGHAALQCAKYPPHCVNAMTSEDENVEDESFEIEKSLSYIGSLFDFHFPSPSFSLNNDSEYIFNISYNHNKPLSTRFSKQQIHNNLLIVQGKICGQDAQILIDPGAQGCFVSSKFAHCHRFPLHQKSTPTMIGPAFGSGVANLLHINN